MSYGIQHEAYQMVFFNALTTAGSLTQAAKRLNVSVSHVSKQLQNLEDELNVQLLNRSTRKLALTQEGKDFATYCDQVVGLINNANSHITESRDDISGNVRLALSCSFGSMHILPILDQLQQKYPELTIEISLIDYKIDILEEQVDLWFTTFEDINTGLVAQRIVDTNFMLLASPAYIAKHGQPTHPEELINHNCITYHSKNRSYTNWLFTNNGFEHNIQVTGNYRVDKAEAVRDAVLAGKGLGYIASYLLTDELKLGQLVPLMPEWKPTQKMPVYAVYPKYQNLPHRLKTIISFIKDTIGSPPYWDNNTLG